MMLKVAIVIIPEAFPHSIIEPLDVFSRCQTIYQRRTGQTHSHKPQVALVAESLEQTIEFSGIRISPTHDIWTTEKFDVVWVPSLMVDEALSYRQRKKCNAGSKINSSMALRSQRCVRVRFCWRKPAY